VKKKVLELITVTRIIILLKLLEKAGFIKRKIRKN